MKNDLINQLTTAIGLNWIYCNLDDIICHFIDKICEFNDQQIIFALQNVNHLLQTSFVLFLHFLWFSMCVCVSTILFRFVLVVCFVLIVGDIS